MKKHILSLFLSTILIIAAITVSAEVTTDDASSVVTLTGVVPSKQSGVNIGIDVFCPGMGYEDLRQTPVIEFKRVLVMRNQVVSGENGEWSFTFKIIDDPALDYDAKSGTYTAVIFSEDAANAYQETFVYVNLKAAEQILNSLRENGNDAVEIKQLLENGKYDLGIGYDFESDLNKDSIASLLQREISAGALDEVITAEGINVVRMAVLIEAINEGRIDNLFDYAEVLRITDCALAPFCEKDYIIQNEKNITTRMKGEAIESFEEFYGQLTEKAVLSVVENPDGVGNIEEITTAFASEIGIELPLASNVYQNVMGKSFNSYTQLKEAMNRAGTSQSSQGGSSGGKSPGGSAGSAIVGGNDSQQAEPMEYDIFSDIGNVSWAKDAIVYLAQKGIVNGKEKNLFYPNDNIKREELAAILVAAFAPDAPETEIYFNDVDKSSWYYSAVAKAAGADIIKGYSDDWFGSGENITRQDMVTMIYRAAVSSGIRLESAQISFSDENEIADYAKEAVGALTNSDIVNGMDFNTFSPTGFATRAQAAKIIYGLLML